MNVNNCMETANLIENQPHVHYDDPSGFTMARYFHDCGTPACIAGFAVAVKHSVEGTDTIIELGEPLKYGTTSYSRVAKSVREEAAAFLGIEEKTDVNKLFLAHMAPDELNAITPKQAATVLRTYATTGLVDWEAAGVTFGATEIDEHEDA